MSKDASGPEALGVFLELLIGPTGEFTDEQLEIAWEVERERIMANHGTTPAGARPVDTAWTRRRNPHHERGCVAG